MTNINKSGKIRVVFDSGVRYEDTSLNEKLYKGPKLLSNLIGPLLDFGDREYNGNFKRVIRTLKT